MTVFDSNRNYVGMIALACDFEHELVRFSFPREIDFLDLTLDQADSLASILKKYVEARHELERSKP